MPKKLEQALRKGARKAGLKGRAADRYVYGSDAMQEYEKKKKKKKGR